MNTVDNVLYIYLQNLTMNLNLFHSVFFLILFFSAFSLNAQENTLQSLAKIEIGGQGINLSYETPLSKSFLLDLSVGLGPSYEVYDNSMSYVINNFKNPSLFLQGELIWLYNREKRATNGKSLANNAGNSIAFQTKYSLGQKDEIDQNKALLNEIHWGFQRSLGESFYFNTHAGLGYIHDFENKEGSLYPAIGFRFGYVFLKMK